MSNEDLKQHAGLLLFILLAIPILYVLLLGPAALLHHVLPPAGRDCIEMVYYPLEWLDQKIPGQPFEKYVQWWNSFADAVL